MYVQTAITLFNKRLSADRREVYFPTCITGASFFESKSSSHSTDGAHSESLTYKLRIPIDAKVQDDKTYLSEMAFKALTAEEAADHWTIQKGDIVQLNLSAKIDGYSAAIGYPVILGKLEGKRLFIHAASDGPETGVIVSSLDDGYWAKHLTGYGRVLAETAAPNPAQ